MSVRKGQPWERPASGAADLAIRGRDADLARAVVEHPGSRFEFEPTASDLAATLGLHRGRTGSALELDVDALRITTDAGVDLAVAWVIMGVDPRTIRWWHRRRKVVIEHDGRTESVAVSGVVAFVAQHLGGMRVVPRGHPGDGRAELQWFALAPGERTKMRTRLPTGDHLDHPEVGTCTFRTLTLRSRRPLPIRIDGESRTTAREVRIEVVRGAVHLVV